MNNFEWIKSMDKETFARWLAYKECINTCSYSDKERDCVEEDYPCFRGIKEWLDMEVDEVPTSTKNSDIENYADLFISHIIEDLQGVRLDYKIIVKQVVEKMLEKIK